MATEAVHVHGLCGGAGCFCHRRMPVTVVHPRGAAADGRGVPGRVLEERPDTASTIPRELLELPFLAVLACSDLLLAIRQGFDTSVSNVVMCVAVRGRPTAGRRPEDWPNRASMAVFGLVVGIMWR